MGQKTHPKGFRLGIVTEWDSKWFAEKEYSQFLHEDLKIQNFIKERMMRAGISRVEIERYADKRVVTIHTARPGIVIGRRGGEVDKLRSDLESFIGHEIRINIEEVARPELDAQLVSESVALQLERRVHFRKAMKKSVSSAIRAGAEGIKVLCSGRLGGAEMARKEQEKEGRIPLHTIRADIDYGFTEAMTTAGKIGVKCWIFKGEKLAPNEVSIRTDTESTIDEDSYQDRGSRRRGSDRRDRRGSDRRGSDRRSSDRRGSDRRGSDRRGSNRDRRGGSDRRSSGSNRRDSRRSDNSNQNK
ncbi:30S ribosomal protein S3 [Candidatus Poribacteria bacterium]|nr:30S ribosomal protein S3 [Candidatus Poribacteria bacterium]